MISTELYQLMVRELGADHPKVKALTKQRHGEFAEQLQKNLGLHPTLIKLRRASKEYELGEVELRVRIAALKACEDAEINDEFVIKALEQGRRDARIARAVRNSTM